MIAKFQGIQGVVANSSGFLFVSDCSGHRIRLISPDGLVSTLAGSGTPSFSDGVGTAASFNTPSGLAVWGNNLYVCDYLNQRIRVVASNGSVTTMIGNGVLGSIDGLGTSATVFNPRDLAVNTSGYLFLANDGGNNIRIISTLTNAVTTFPASGFSNPFGVDIDQNGVLYVGDRMNNRVASVNPGAVVSIATGFSPYGVAYARNGILFVASPLQYRVIAINTSSLTLTTIAGVSGSSGMLNGYGTAAKFLAPATVTVDNIGVVYVGDGTAVRQLTCVPCPASYYCFSGAPVLCPGGSSCPLSSINSTLCPIGTYSNAGASKCTLCPNGTYTSATGSTSCQQCPGGHYCPAGTSSWTQLNCGRGNYCPDGSGAPTPCPFQVPPAGGWGALQVQGPAFLVETAYCLNHCFWNFTSGDGVLSKC